MRVIGKVRIGGVKSIRQGVEACMTAARDEAKENTRGRGQGKLDVYVLDA